MCLWDHWWSFVPCTLVDWLKEEQCTSKSIWISSTSTNIHCLMKGNIIEALHDSVVEACIISECLMDTLVGNKPLTPTDKYFRSPSGLLFECWGIARDVRITIDKIEVHLDFYIYDILDFDLLLGLPLEKLLASHGNWNRPGSRKANPTRCIVVIVPGSVAITYRTHFNRISQT